MNFEPVEAIADAILFEGYILYPYRASAIKNRQRWHFGTLYPMDFAEAQSATDSWRFATEVLIEAEETATLTVRVRFLQLTSAKNKQVLRWEEGFARNRTIERMGIPELSNRISETFDLSGLSPDEIRHASPGLTERPRLARLTLSIDHLRGKLYCLHASVSNESPVGQGELSCEALQDVAFHSAHLLLGIEDGTFVSLLEPPAGLGADAQACKHDGVFPVLAGEPGNRSRMFCSPIILYDYPQVAPESTGEFFDSTEMDEMLALRVLTLTDEEKVEMRSIDRRARMILERTESLPEGRMASLHGAIRELERAMEPESTDNGNNEIKTGDPFVERPRLESVSVFGVELRKGDRVRLWPQKKADIMDMALEGKVAVIEAIEEDLEGNAQFAVVVEEDPGRDMGILRQAGHRFFFSPNEIEPLQLEVR